MLIVPEKSIGKNHTYMKSSIAGASQEMLCCVQLSFMKT